MKVSVDKLKEDLKKKLSEKRYIHTLGVAEEAKKLAKLYGADQDKAEIAGLLHDIAKEWPKDKLLQYINMHEEVNDELLNYSLELWHGPVASVYVQNEYNVVEKEIINSIRYHTSGRPRMSLLEKVVCLADYIEPSRDYPGVEELRKISTQNLDEALLKAFNGTIMYLLKLNQQIYPLTISARNSLISETTTNEFLGS